MTNATLLTLAKRMTIKSAVESSVAKIEAAVLVAFSKGQSGVKSSLVKSLPDALAKAFNRGVEIGVSKLKVKPKTFDGAEWIASHVDDIATSIADTSKTLSDPFTQDRAHLIAAHEAQTCVMQGQRMAWAAAYGMELRTAAGGQGRTKEGKYHINPQQRMWVTGADPCPECEDMEGETVAMDDDYSNGVYGPPLHPYCECEEDLVEGD